MRDNVYNAKSGGESVTPGGRFTMISLWRFSADSHGPPYRWTTLAMTAS